MPRRSQASREIRNRHANRFGYGSTLRASLIHLPSPLLVPGSGILRERRCFVNQQRAVSFVSKMYYGCQIRTDSSWILKANANGLRLLARAIELASARGKFD